MRTIWTAEEAEHHGDFVEFGPIWSWPKPLQQPHPPILVGGNGPRAEERVLAYGDGWFPQYGAFESIDELRQRAQALRGKASKAVPITIFHAPPDPRELDALAEAGADRCLILLEAGTEKEILTGLDVWANALGIAQAPAW